MGSTIPLAKGLDLSKMTFPALLSEKFDGVPVLVRYDGFNITTQTRQGKPLPSVQFIMNDLEVRCRATEQGAFEFVGEVIQIDSPRAPFRETGGIVRRQEPQHGLCVMVFDGTPVFKEHSNFNQRMADIHTVLSQTSVDGIEVVHQQMVTTQEAFEFNFGRFTEANPDAEGMVLRSMSDVYEPGKRQWGYQKVLNEPTLDLEVVGFEEAVCGKTGAGKGMVGRVNVMYRGNIIGCGPGKMTHKERKELWDMWYNPEPGAEFGTSLAEIKHKGDASYDALRQPTFQRWRTDKDEADA